MAPERMIMRTLYQSVYTFTTTDIHHSVPLNGNEQIALRKMPDRETKNSFRLNSIYQHDIIIKSLHNVHRRPGWAQK